MPDVPAGEYLVLLYDGSEGGDHYTLDRVTVRRRPVQAPAGSEASDSSTGRGWFPTGPVVAGLVLLSAAGGLLSVRHRRARYSGARHERDAGGVSHGQRAGDRSSTPSRAARTRGGCM